MGEEEESVEEFFDCHEGDDSSLSATQTFAVDDAATEALPTNSSEFLDAHFPPHPPAEEKRKQDEETEVPVDEYFVDEGHLRQLEAIMSEEQKLEQKEIALKLKTEGNRKFGNGEFEAAIQIYTEALQTCPTTFHKDRSVLYGNRAAAFIKSENLVRAVEDCSRSLECDPNYCKALYRRAWCYEQKEETLEKAVEDYVAVLKLEPNNIKAKTAIPVLEEKVKERNEKMKNEMIGKLKDLGNMVLGRWGMSCDDFKLEQNPQGGYSVNMRKS